MLEFFFPVPNYGGDKEKRQWHFQITMSPQKTLDVAMH